MLEKQKKKIPSGAPKEGKNKNIDFVSRGKNQIQTCPEQKQEEHTHAKKSHMRFHLECTLGSREREAKKTQLPPHPAFLATGVSLRRSPFDGGGRRRRRRRRQKGNEKAPGIFSSNERRKKMWMPKKERFGSWLMMRQSCGFRGFLFGKKE